MAELKFYRTSTSHKVLMIADMTMLAFIYLLTNLSFENSIAVAPAPVIETFLMIGMVLIIFFKISIFAVGLYNIKLRESQSGIFYRLFFSTILSYILSILFFNATGLLVSDALFVEVFHVYAFIGLVFVRYIAKLINYEQLGQKKVLVIGAGERASIIEKTMRRRADRNGFDLVGFVHIRGDKSLFIDKRKIIHHTTTMNEIEELIDSLVSSGRADEIVIAADERRENIPVECLFKCKIYGIEVIDIVNFIERETGQIAVSLVHPSWFLNERTAPMTYPHRVFDRAVNVLLATLVVLLTWPLMLLAVVLIKIEDGLHSPVLYSQKRVGYNGLLFDIYKFRSMTEDAEAQGAKWASKEDPRVTRVGKFLRKYRIDELPQLWNVLRGDMCFVGPRPERPQFCDSLEKDIPYYRRRLLVKPGLTGWAQLKYPYGSSVKDAREKLQYDLFYIKHRSFLLDVAILVRTSEIILFGRGQ
ncbi:TIGR03013 family PEP-CTERM/XrtA system glycosyltransferase [Parasalinivibrio latis]|uniref:TIGR03013 family XrtA/PEP-CTERM system glycosyltransferase n=1 Tax=Parasalinivibrio latis TaxID=2952610 RepID=UPI0030E16B1A